MSALDSEILQELRAITDRIGELANEQVRAVKTGSFGEAERIASEMREFAERQRELCNQLKTALQVR